MAESKQPPFDRSLISRCGTTEYMEKLKLADPSLQGRLNDFESQVQAYIKKNNPSSSPQRVIQKEDRGGGRMCYDIALSLAGGCFLIEKEK
jgi:hypothetical protein